jgi:O-antigen/teichoic acid export membrane protein
MFWRGVWGYLPAQAVQGVVGVLAIVVFTRLLTPEQFGQYALAFSVMTLSHVLAFSWVEAAMARFWASEVEGPGLKAHFASLYRTAFLLIAVFVPVAALLLWLVPINGALKLALAVALGGAPVRFLVKLAQERYRAAGEVARAAGLDIFVALAGFAVGAGFAVWGAGAASPFWGLALAPLAALPLLLPGELKRARDGVVDIKRLKAYAAYGYPIAASLTLALVLASTDRFLLALFLTEAAVGAYHAGYSLANRTLDVIFIWLGAASGPALILALERGGREALVPAAREQSATFLLVGLPAAAGLALVARPLAEVMIGEELRGAAASITPWIALSALLWGLSAYYYNVAFILGRKTKLLFATMAVPALANLALNAVLIPRFGLMGAAWATTASFALGLATSLVLGRRAEPMPTDWSALMRCGIATIAMAAVVLILPPIGGFAELMMDATVGATVYAVLALMLNAAGVRDVAQRLIRRRREAAA